MKPSLRLVQKQQLALTPQIQQTLRMLQLGAKELSQEIDQALLDNPLLTESSQHQLTSSATDTAWLENLADQNTQNLETYLLEQLNHLSLKQADYQLANLIISHIGDDGYLRISNEELLLLVHREIETADTAQLEQIIQLIQTFDPAGIGCRDLAECFELQLKRLNIEPDLRHTTLQLSRALSLNAQPKLEQIKKELKLEPTEFEQACQIIQSLEANPGQAFTAQPTQFIVPDILLAQSPEGLRIRLNPQIDRSIELNQHYIDILQTSKKAEDQQYLKSNLNPAKWWINALKQRNQTLLTITEHIIDRQSQYFDHGDQSTLTPLTQQQIAEHCQLHRSTVSRSLRDKYLQSPLGSMALKQLLTGKITTHSGKNVSDQRVKGIIKKLIENEPSQTPLSDSKIVLELKHRGIKIARRTVNKYRQQMNIPASSRRRLTS